MFAVVGVGVGRFDDIDRNYWQREQLAGARDVVGALDVGALRVDARQQRGLAVSRRGRQPQGKISFSTQIVERVQEWTGLGITVHQFRHAAGALILKHRPGEYELVRRVLGHKSAQTTKNFYLSLETTQASEIFTDIVRQRLDFTPGAT